MVFILARAAGVEKVNECRRKGFDRRRQESEEGDRDDVDGDQMREKRSGIAIMQHAVAMLLTRPSLG